MPRLARHNELVTLYMLTMDLACISLAIFGSLWLLPGNAQLSNVITDILDNRMSFLVVFIMWFLVGTTQGMFVSHRQDPLLYQLYQTCKSVVMTMAMSYVLISFGSGESPEVWFALLLAIGSLFTLSTFRILLTLVLWALRQQGFNVREIVIVGANPRSAELVKMLTERGQYGYSIVGVIDDDKDRMHYLAPYGLRYAGGFDELEELVAARVVDEVHIALPVRSHYETIQHAADVCLGVGVTIRMVADLFPLKLANSRIHQLDSIPMLSLTTVSENQFQLAIKRLLDIVTSLSLLILISPLMIAVAIGVKLSSPGPVFFLQERVGLNKRRFKMIKFRSMAVDAEDKKHELQHLNEADGPIFKIKHDPRVTPIGAIIRKYSIDELPQLINVLKGEMSLVGPRPHPTREVESYTWHHRRRLSVKPGMTGLAQVSGRSDLSWEECVELDLSYIDGWTVLSDFWILLRTVRVVVAAEGAT